MLRILAKERGFSLIEAIIAAAAMTALGLAGYSIFSGVSKQMAGSGLIAGVNTARNSVLEAVNSSLAWSNTLAENPALECVKNRSSCASLLGTNIPVKLIDASGTLILTDPVDPAVGFDPQGRSCHSFPSASCPIRFELFWTPICSPATCTNPQERISGTLFVKSSNDPSQDKLKNTVNVTIYSFVAFRGATFGSFADLCKALQGVWDNGAKTCRLPLKGPCPDGQVVVGIDAANNTKICRQLWMSQSNNIGYASCASGQVMKGITSSGDPICFAIDYGTCNSACYANPDVCTVWPPTTGVDGWTGGDGGGDGGCGGSDGSDGGCGS
jgi:uncharacterized membrane protein YgcG